jgi:hypothetical protein
LLDELGELMPLPKKLLRPPSFSNNARTTSERHSSSSFRGGGEGSEICFALQAQRGVHVSSAVVRPNWKEMPTMKTKLRYND